MSSRAQRSVLITGANGGLGTALVRAFVEDGYRVIATDRDAKGFHDTYVQVDLNTICSDAGARDLFSKRVQELVEGELVALVNNAAVQILGDSASFAIEDWEHVMRVNVTAPFLLTQMFLNRMARVRGSVVNISSVHAVATKPGFVAYAVSKAGIAGLTRALAVDLGGKIRVNSVLPAAIETQMMRDGFRDRPDALARLGASHPIGRIADAAEVAAVVLFLASPKAQFITGSSWTVDGGILSRLHDPV
jgi:NAD(P)-dependent dehydrogenase (short-subunit alcohol dehydrogenase family)